MTESRSRRKNWTRLAALAVFAVFVLPAAAAQKPARPSASALTRIEVARAEPAGIFGGVAYSRYTGTARGVVDPGDAVVGLAALPKNAVGQYEYASAFEIIAPSPEGAQNEVVYLDSENRGGAVSQGALGGFLQNHATSYARIQWQTGISPGVPANAQGVGLVIMRDFARWLGGRTPQTVVNGPHPAAHAKLILGGISQSAWLVNTFVAEGFNVDPVTGARVVDAAIAVDGIGNWLAINKIAAERGAAQRPYVDPNGRPLSRARLLSRPATDPLYVDVANYTDFYRLRAGLTSTAYSGAGFRRYDWPSPHAVPSAEAAARCNGGRPIDFSTIRYAPYMRALVLGIEREIGVKAAAGAKRLPHSQVFALGGQPPAGPGFNGLPGVRVPAPRVDAAGWPIGGVRFPEADVPLGRPMPVALAPAVTTSINETCGNFGGFVREGQRPARDAYLRNYDAALRRLIEAGFLLQEDRAGMLRAAQTAFDAG